LHPIIESPNIVPEEVKADSVAQDPIPDVKEVIHVPILLQEVDKATREHVADEVATQVPV
jgi:hypothetical protein